jgi:hypothetical protein
MANFADQTRRVASYFFTCLPRGNGVGEAGTVPAVTPAGRDRAKGAGQMIFEEIERSAKRKLSDAEIGALGKVLTLRHLAKDERELRWMFFRELHRMSAQPKAKTGRR